MMVENVKLGHLGPGFPMYFQFIKFCILLLVWMLLTDGILILNDNLHGNFCSDKHGE